MGNWSDDAVTRLKAQQSEKSQQDARFLEEQRIKRAQGFAYWKQIRASARDNCTEFNQKYGGTALRFQVGQEMSLLVASDINHQARQLSANYNENSTSISWQCVALNGDTNPVADGTIEICIGSDGAARMQEGVNPVSVDGVVAKMLNRLIFG